MKLPPFNPLSPEFQTAPFETYARLLERKERALPFAPKTWLVTRHAEIATWLRNDQVMIRDRDRTLRPLGSGPFYDYNYNIMAMMDRPHHGVVRKVVAHAFTPRALDRLKTVMERTADSLLAEVRPGEPFDLLNDFAVKLPLFVICDLLGVSTEHEALLKRVSSGLTMGSEGFAPKAVRDEADEVCRLMRALVADELEKRGPAPEGDDVISVYTPVLVRILPGWRVPPPSGLCSTDLISMSLWDLHRSNQVSSSEV